MTDFQRAREWVALLTRAGDRWRGCLPVDSVKVNENAYRLGSEVLVRDPHTGRWLVAWW